MRNPWTDCRKWIRIWALGATLIGISQIACAAALRDVWPLVNRADHAVWGTLVEIQERGDDRLLVLSTHAPVGSQVPFPAPRLRLLEPAGRLPEGTPLWPGVSGLFLYVEVVDGAGATEPVDGLLLPNGLVPGIPGALERMAVGSLLDGASGQSLAALDNALALLAGPSREWRHLALRWLQERPPVLPPAVIGQLRQAFENESDSEIQGDYLELFLRHQVPAAAERATSLVLQEQDHELADLALFYLERLGTTQDRAQLLAAYPTCPAGQRGRLLRALARLEVPLPYVLWEQALLSDDKGLASSAIGSLASSGCAEAPGIYRSLLESSSPEIRRVAIRGLATLGNASDIATLRQFATDITRDVSTRKYARQVLAHPYRYGVAPPPGRR